MSKERLRVLDNSVCIDIFDLLDGKDIHGAQLELAKLAGKYADAIVSKGHEAKFSVDYYGYDGGLDLYLNFYRDENDKEYAARMDKEEKAREKKRLAKEKKIAKARKLLEESEAVERAEYERLRAKFEGGLKVGDVDRQSGAFTQDEIDNSTAWR